MTTIEKILLTLQNNSDEKKTRITNSYQEKSVWLRNEFDVIRKLIKQNPRDNLNTAEVIEPVKQVMFEAPAPSSSTRELSNDGKKRRSPETVNEEKLSPEHKRASVDVEEIFAQAGLPSDLNRLTKAQLLDELEKHGVDSYTSKALKNTLIDALRYHLVSTHHTRGRKVEPDVSAVDEVATDAISSPVKAPCAASVADVEESTSMVIATPSKPSAAPVPASARKISNISDIRSMVQDNLSASQTLACEKAAGCAEGDAEKQKKIRVESEFRNRYSSMTARKSIVASEAAAVAPVVEVSSAKAPEPAVVEVKPEPANVVAPVAETAAHPKDSLCSTDSIWMEVSSPVRPESETVTATAAPAPIPCGLEQMVDVCENASVELDSPATGSPEEGATRARTESDASFVSCVSTGSNVPKSSAASTSSATGSSKVASSAGPVKQGAKMTAYASETKASAGPVKSVVPSMQKVKLAPKTAEDQRSMLLAKKAAVPSQGDKTSASAKPTFSTSTSAPAVSQTAPAAKPAAASVTVAPAAPAAAAPVAAPSAPSAPVPATATVAPVSQPSSAPTISSVPAVAATPVAASAPGAALSQKKSIFGTMFGSSKKNAPTTTGATPTAALASSGEIKKPVTAASAPPAMVDAIIKSAKAADTPPAPTPVAAVVAPVPSVAAPATAPVTAVKAESAAARIQTPPEAKEPVSLSSSGKAVALKDAMSSKSLISSIVNNYNNALKSGNNAVHGAHTSGPLSVAPAAAAPVLRDITASATAPASSVKAAPVPVAAPVAAPSVAAPAAVAPATPSAARTAAPSATPSAAAAAAAASKEYVIEDRDSSDESGTDGEGEESEEAKKKKQNIPEWARGPMLKEALERQYGLSGQAPVDPDLIFPEVTTCSLEEIFGIKEGINRKYGARSSSAHWEADQMTLVEKRSYRKHMGYDRAQAQACQAGQAK